MFGPQLGQHARQLRFEIRFTGDQLCPGERGLWVGSVFGDVILRLFGSFLDEGELAGQRRTTIRKTSDFGDISFLLLAQPRQLTNQRRSFGRKVADIFLHEVEPLLVDSVKLCFRLVDLLIYELFGGTRGVNGVLCLFVDVLGG